MQNKRIQVEFNGKIVWVIPRIIIRNGFFWGFVESTQKVEFFKNEQIKNLALEKVTKKMNRLKLM